MPRLLRISPTTNQSVFWYLILVFFFFLTLYFPHYIGPDHTHISFVDLIRWMDLELYIVYMNSKFYASIFGL